MKAKLRIEAENFRVRVAREKRERMYAPVAGSYHGSLFKAQWARVCRHRRCNHSGERSRGTFYKHFDTLGQAFAALGSQLVDDTVRALAAMFEGVDDPLHRTSSGLQLMLIHAIVDPDLGGLRGPTPTI